jgi:dipeptidase
VPRNQIYRIYRLAGSDSQVLTFIFLIKRYFDGDYGVMNEKGVAIGESSCSAKIFASACKYIGQREIENNCALLSINELSRIALERASSAREAISIIGELATKHGFYGPRNKTLF